MPSNSRPSTPPFCGTPRRFRTGRWWTSSKIPVERNEVAVVPLGVLRCARDVEVARRFMEYVVSREAQEIFRAHGYTPAMPEGLEAPSL